ncbi:MAG: hypothetical protein WBH85_16505 [Thermoanaerobaculia bacterium]
MRRTIRWLVVILVAFHGALAYAVDQDVAGTDSPAPFEIPRLDDFNNVSVIVTGTPEVKKKKKFYTAAANVSDALVEKLIAARVFENVSAEEPAGASATDLIITLLIDDLKITSQGGRVMGGIAAGKARLGLNVSLTAGDSTEPLAEFYLSSVSKQKHGVFGGTTGRQIEGMTDRIARAIITQKE